MLLGQLDRVAIRLVVSNNFLDLEEFVCEGPLAVALLPI